MANRSLKEKNVRKITKVGGKSFSITFPIEIIKKLGWREKQKVTVNLRGKKVVTEDWKK